MGWDTFHSKRKTKMAPARASCSHILFVFNQNSLLAWERIILDTISPFLNVKNELKFMIKLSVLAAVSVAMLFFTEIKRTQNDIMVGVVAFRTFECILGMCMSRAAFFFLLAIRHWRHANCVCVCERVKCEFNCLISPTTGNEVWNSRLVVDRQANVLW